MRQHHFLLVILTRMFDNGEIEMTTFENCGIHWASKNLLAETHKLWADNMDGSHCSLLCESDDISEIHRQWAIFTEMGYTHLSIEHC